MRVLIIGKIWPEPRSSAAGTRTLDLIRSLKSPPWDLHFACAAQASEYSAELSNRFTIETHQIKLNCSSFDKWVATLAPDIVIFDRYMTEEQFGWRVAQALPNALRVIDTSDLHCLREARRLSLANGGDLELQNEIALREIAALLRCDLSLIISEAEMEILQRDFPLPASSLAYWPFALPAPLPNTPPFEERSGFVMIGSFMHEPNWDAVRYCRETIWPLIRELLPAATIDVYGSYTPAKAEQLHNPKAGFHIRGRADEAIPTLAKYRVNLAPLRFGAGLKGKLADAFIAGTPSAATPVATEGMHGALEWGSLVASDPALFAQTAVDLYSNSHAWSHAQSCGYEIARMRFAETHWLPKLHEILETALENRDRNRASNFVGQLLNHHQHRSIEFMSRWIEAKNKNPRPTEP